jgi:hypothetical protein
MVSKLKLFYHIKYTVDTSKIFLLELYSYTFKFTVGTYLVGG